MEKHVNVEQLLNNLPNDLPYKASVKRVLIQAPTADVVEVRHGEWKHSMEVGQIYNYHYWNCSLCGASAFTSGYEKYCHECGAKMDGGKAE
jgi:hypothetical protein